MGVIAPTSSLRFYKGIDITEDRNRIFRNKTEQGQYFLSHSAGVYQAMTYQRHGSNGIKVEISDDLPLDVIVDSNYISFINSSFEQVQFYAKKTGWEYINNVTYVVYYEIDWLQTYMFETNYLPSKIAREQLSINQMRNAQMNPHIRTIPEMSTQEPFEVNAGTEAWADPRVGPWPTNSGDKNLPVCLPQAGITYRYTFRGFDRNTSTLTITDNLFTWDSDDVFLVFILSKFDWADDTQTGKLEYASFLNAFDFTYGIALGGSATAGYKKGDDNFGYLSGGIPRPFGIAGIKITDEWDNRLERILNILTKKELESSIVSICLATGFILYSELSPLHSPVSSKMINTEQYRINEQYWHPKCKTYPFRKVRVISPDGTIYDYNPRDFFGSLGGGTTTPEFHVSGSFFDNCSITLMPVNYRGTVNDFYESELPDANIGEAIAFRNQVELPYTTDSYLAYVASQYNMTGMERLVKAVTSAFKGAASGAAIGSVAGSIGGPVGSAIGGLGGGSLAFIGAALGVGGEKLKQDAAASILGGETNPITDAIIGGRAKYAAETLHGSNLNGVQTYLYKKYYYTIYTVIQEYNYTEMISNHFYRFGVNSGQYHVPRVCEYIKHGVGDGEKAPAQWTINGVTGSYCQTDSMDCEAPNEEAAAYIKRIFNHGAFFVTAGEEVTAEDGRESSSNATTISSEVRP